MKSIFADVGLPQSTRRVLVGGQASETLLLLDDDDDDDGGGRDRIFHQINRWDFPIV